MAYFNVIKRQQRIIQIIRKHKPTLKQLIEKLGNEGIDNCSQRTIQRDLEEIRLSFGLEIIFDKLHRVYFIKQESDDSRDAIYDYIDRATISESISKRLFDKNRTLNKQYIITDTPLFLEYNSGIHHFDPLLFACIEKRVVLISYSPKYQRKKLQNYEVYPLALKEFRHRWYLLCQKAQSKILYSFALDRIEELEISPKKMPLKGLINHEKAYESVYGITNPADMEPVFIRVKAHNAFSEYMKSIPWHSSQKIIEEGAEETTFEFYLKPNLEFMQLILMQANDVKVESPKSLVKSIQMAIKSMANRYGSD